jgi:IS30 family transposase
MPGVRLGFEEREKIALGIARGEPLCDIACRLRRPTSTISREVHRCGGPEGYTASGAQRDPAFEPDVRSAASWW